MRRRHAMPSFGHRQSFTHLPLMVAVVAYSHTSTPIYWLRMPVNDTAVADTETDYRQLHSCFSLLFVSFYLRIVQRRCSNPDSLTVAVALMAFASRKPSLEVAPTSNNISSHILHLQT